MPVGNADLSDENLVVVQAHCFRQPFSNHHLQSIHYPVDELRERYHLIFTEVGQDIISHVATCRPADAGSEAVVAAAPQFLMQRAESVVTTMAAICFAFEIGRAHV